MCVGNIEYSFVKEELNSKMTIGHALLEKVQTVFLSNLRSMGMDE